MFSLEGKYYENHLGLEIKWRTSYAFSYVPIKNIRLVDLTLKLNLSVYFLPQISHSCTFLLLVVCNLTCLVKLPFCAKPLPHIFQIKGLSPVWIRMWSKRFQALFKWFGATFISTPQHPPLPIRRVVSFKINIECIIRHIYFVIDLQQIFQSFGGHFFRLTLHRLKNIGFELATSMTLKFSIIHINSHHALSLLVGV